MRSAERKPTPFIHLISGVLFFEEQETQMTIPKELENILTADEDTLSGAVRFKGTRVPVQALFDTILGGENVDYFIDDFPDISKSHAMAVLEWEQNQARKVLGVALV